jgi:hypothetical protein
MLYARLPATTAEQDAAIAFCYKTLSELGMTGRLRIAREVTCTYSLFYASSCGGVGGNDTH